MKKAVSYEAAFFLLYYGIEGMISNQKPIFLNG